MSPDEVRALPVVVPWWPTAATALGYGQHSAYRAAKDGSAPVPVLRRGRRLVVLRSALLAALGIEDAPPAPIQPTTAPASPPADQTSPPRLHAVAYPGRETRTARSWHIRAAAETRPT